jgi:phosphoglucomutase
MAPCQSSAAIAIKRSEELRPLVLRACGAAEAIVQSSCIDRDRRRLEREHRGVPVNYRAEVEALKLEIDGLHTAMLTRAVIEQAKGMLMLREKCSADEAFATLRKTSQAGNMKLHEVAVWLVNSVR